MLKYATIPIREDFRTDSPAGKELTEFSNAERLVARFGNLFRYNTSEKAFFIWDGIRWTPDQRMTIEYLAKLTVMDMYREASEIQEKGARLALVNHALKSETARKMLSMITLAKSEPGVAITTNDLDRDDWLLNCQNCTIDLDASKWKDSRPVTREHDQRDHITKCIPVDYDPTAQCPRWKQFLREITDGDTNLEDFLQRMCGYFLTGSTAERCVFFFFGTGDNGKSVFLGTLRQLLGDYSKNAQADSFMTKESQSIRTDLARLAGNRLVTVSETDQNKKLAEGLIKQLAGGDSDRLTVRHLYGEEFDLDVKFKLAISMNHKPRINDDGPAIWKRIRLVPFEKKVDPKKIDTKLSKKLQAELPGILNWCLEGVSEWSEMGLLPPLAVVQATAEYRKEMDGLGTFVSECFIPKKGSRVLVGDAYLTYVDWAEANGEYVMSKREMCKRMIEKDYKKYKDAAWYWRDLEIAPTAQVKEKK